MAEHKRLKVLPIVLLTFFTLLLLYLNVKGLIYSIETMSFWGFPEISQLASGGDKQAKLEIEKCPIFIKPGETKYLIAKATNISDQPIKRIIQTVISYPEKPYGFVLRRKVVEIESGGSDTFTRDLTERNLIDGKRIQIRVYLGDEITSFPYHTETCRVIKFGIGSLSSSASGALVITVSLLGMIASGLWFTKLDQGNINPFRPKRLIVFVFLVSLLMTMATLIDSWWIGLLLLIIIVEGVLSFAQEALNKKNVR
jgi:hypothetical protein